MARFVVVEGLDGVGKSTAVGALAVLFSGRAMSTPGPALHSSRSVVLEAFSQDELAKALFYVASVSSEGRQARRLADSGVWVFMDRYWASTLAYAKARGVRADLDALGKNLFQPDITILLTLNEQQRQKRLLARGATAEDLETLKPDFRHTVLRELNARADTAIDTTGLNVNSVVNKLTFAIQGFAL